MRALNRIVAAVLALVLFAAALLTIIEVVLAALGRPYWLVPYSSWSDWMAEQSFASAGVRAVLIGVVVLGLILLLVALRRGRPGSLALSSGAEGVRFTASRRGIEHTLARAAGRIDGVQDVHARVGRRRARVRTVTTMRSPGDLRQQVADAVDTQLRELDLDAVRPQISVSRKAAR